MDATPAQAVAYRDAALADLANPVPRSGEASGTGSGVVINCRSWRETIGWKKYAQSSSITASENLTNCWSHYGGAGCPRCARRTPAEVIAAVNAFFCEGIRQAGAGARMIAWDWGWKDEWAEETIRRLPPSSRSE